MSVQFLNIKSEKFNFLTYIEATIFKNTALLKSTLKCTFKSHPKGGMRSGVI